MKLTLLAPLALAGLVSTSPTALLEKRAVTCLKVGATATATWKNSAGKTCSWTGTVGSNFGTNSVTGGDYSCNGRCGAGCSGTALGNAYTQDCFSHDVCSWFNNASGGASDANCGAAYDAAVDDTLLGVVNGCGQSNPTNAASRPSTSPTCS
ncbi:uncharacterized protein EKO05_0008575 [Ascochyta rabiei]|uniref:DUF8213 domain-containing protein n=1 Tax=Didymella rabiei TaxID=5454 RepID=A0A163G1V0_DIDRA|nr:uncharacterized protein EKO05_0008575 [Ascochyta rabiei]KZM24638.1 hypothetical protein ST47_g4348 [Ascochyta rabiei]UPX18271.1 hypothetical protein EKO05_0008575 [Ascochyta rabiei]